MKTRNLIPCSLALAALGVLVIFFPPFQVTWLQFFKDPTPWVHKVAFLLKVYGLPCGMSFGAIVLFQLQGRLGSLGASASSVFPLALVGAGLMMMALRSMVSGVGGVPGYALGMALAYTTVSRIHSIQPSGQIVFGRPMVRIVWRGELEAQRKAAALLQRRSALTSASAEATA